MLLEKKQLLEKQHDETIQQEKELILKINSDSEVLSSDEIRALDTERLELVMQRRKLRNQIAHLSNLIRQLSKGSADSIEVLGDLLKG